jgi:ATP-dependent Clp protease adapter protein ClpS
MGFSYSCLSTDNYWNFCLDCTIEDPYHFYHVIQGKNNKDINCDCHTYQQVIALFCKCIPGMNSSRAFELAWRIDHEGQATVYSGERKAAEEIGKKLAAGGLRVGVQ